MANDTVSIVMKTEQCIQLLNILQTIQMPWQVTNPIIMTIAGQLQVQQAMGPQVGNSHLEDLTIGKPSN